MSTAFGKDPLTPAGRWRVVAVVTAAMQVSYWPVVATTVLGDRPDDVVAAGVFVGLGAVPFVFMAVAFTSRHRSAPWAVLRAMALFVVVGAPVGMLHIAAGIAAGYTAGGLATLRPPTGAHPWPARIAMLVAVTVSVTLIVAVAPGVGLVLGSLAPFPALELADRLAVSQASRSQ